MVLNDQPRLCQKVRYCGTPQSFAQPRELENIALYPEEHSFRRTLAVLRLLCSGIQGRLNYATRWQISELAFD